MKLGALILKLVVLGYLAYLLVFLATGYTPEQPGYHPPLIVWLIDTINVFIHEAGHFLFQFFGRWIYIFAGSAFQILLPLALAIVTLLQTPAYVGYAGFWVGESMVNVSPYIKDAPHMKLRLLARGLTHDWNYLLHDHLDWAESLGDAVFLLGLLICIGSLGAGVYFAVRAYREDVVEITSE
jgi:hypothetical protein